MDQDQEMKIRLGKGKNYENTGAQSVTHGSRFLGSVFSLGLWDAGDVSEQR